MTGLAARAETFNGPLLLSTPVDPVGLTSVDVNGDGNLDLIYVDGQSYRNAVHILLGNGDGTFLAGESIPFETAICGACFVNVGDVNGDGRPDLILGGSNMTSAVVAVLFGNGDGTFQNPLVSTIAYNGGITGGMGIGDINGDGALDLVVADDTGNAARVLLGNKTGVFKLSSTLADGGYPTSEYLGDLNGDGHLDVISLGRLGAIATVFLGNGDGTFSQGVRYNIGAATNSLFVADVNGDGHPDVIATTSPNSLVVLAGQADGTFAAPVTLNQNLSYGLVAGVADYNGDNIADIAVLDSTGVGIFIGQGNFIVKPAVSSLSGQATPGTFTQGDFNRDGHMDIAMGVDGGIVVLQGRGDGTFPGPDVYDMGQPAGATAVSDFNGDSIPDIAVTLPAPLPRLLVGKGSGKFTLGPDPNSNYGTGGPGINAVTADFDGDTKTDLAVLAAPPLLSGVLFGNGNGTFSDPLAESWTVVADVNGDGRSDMLSIRTDNGTISALLGQKDRSFSEVDTPLHSILFPNILAVGDINHDGKTDLLIFDYGSLETWLGNGDGTFTFTSSMDVTAAVGQGSQRSGSAALVDLDGDGNLDLALTPGTQFLAIFYGNPDGSFSQPALLPTSHAYTLLNVADLNQDKKPDLVLSDGAGIALIHNLGKRQYGPEDHLTAGPGFGPLSISDVNGDGFPDIVTNVSGVTPSGIPGDTLVAVLLNQPNGTPYGGADTVETITIAPEPSAYTQAFTVAATIAPAGSSVLSPSGSISFSVDGVPSATVALSQLAASYTATTPLSPGTHTVTATYSGDKQFRSVAASAVHTVNPPTYSTTTTLSVSPAVALTSQTIRLEATVTGTSPDQSPSGEVTFYDGTQSLGARQTDVHGTAQLDTALLSAGTHLITASFQGEVIHSSGVWEIFTPSRSAPFTTTVNAVPTVSTLQVSSSSSVASAVVTFTANVSSSSGAPFGGITFYDGTLALGTVSTTTGGNATFSSASLANGAHSITASFAANATFGGSVSQAVNITVSAPAPSLAPTAVALTRQGRDGTQSVFTARVTAQNAFPSGNVVFLDGGTVLGRAMLDAQGQAALSLPSAIRGSHQYRASFEGSAALAPSVSPALMETSPTSDEFFGLALESNVVALSPGGGATLSVKIAALNGFRQPVRLSCGGGIPQDDQCTVLPATLDGSGSALITLASARTTQSPPRGGAGHSGGAIVVGVGCLFCFLTAKRRLKILAVVVTASLALSVLSSCTSGDLRHGNDAAVASILTVQASSGDGATAIVRSSQFTLLVQH